jgi:hypothetical protein
VEGYEEPLPQKKRDRVLSDEEIARVWRVAPPMLKLLALGDPEDRDRVLKRSYVADRTVFIPGQFTKRNHAILPRPLLRPK